MDKLSTLASRLREPSSMAGLAVLAALFGVPAGVPELVAQVVAGAAGLAAMFLPEAGKK